MKVISDWRKALKAYSTWALGIITIIAGVWSFLPMEVVVLFPDHWQPIVIASVSLAGLLGRFIKQGKEDGDS